MARSKSDVIETYKRLIKKSTVRPKKDWKKTIKDRHRNAWFIQCQATLASGKQCSQKAILHKVVCRFHGGKSIKQKTKEMIISEQKNGLYNRETVTILKKEIEEINKVPTEELLDITNDIRLSQAILRNLTSQTVPLFKIGDYYNGHKIISKKQAADSARKEHIRIIKSLQWSVLNNANLKKMLFEVKYSDANTVTKDLFLYFVNKMMQFIKEEVKDLNTLDKISVRVEKLIEDYRSGNVNTR